MSKLTYVSSSHGDWSGIYIDNELDYEGHSIPVWVWLDLFNLSDVIEAVQSEVDGGWLEEGGSFPQNFKDIPEDKFL